jgi:hypothetical protein
MKKKERREALFLLAEYWQKFGVFRRNSPHGFLSGPGSAF